MLARQRFSTATPEVLAPRLLTPLGAMPESAGGAAADATELAANPEPRVAILAAAASASVQPRGVPLWAWLAVLVAVFSMSSGGIWFALLAPSPPVLKAAWRLGVTTVLQLPGLAYQYRRADAELRRAWWAAMPLMGLSGAVLAVHFATWSASIDLTTLTHALLFVCTTPLIIVVWMGVRYGLSRRAAGREQAFAAMTSEPRPGSGSIEMASLSGAGAGELADLREISIESDHPSGKVPVADPGALSEGGGADHAPDRTVAAVDADAGVMARLRTGLIAWLHPASALPPTRLELAGTLVGFLGAAVLILSTEAPDAASGERGVSALGDFVAFLGAASFAVYAEVGARLRKWMPIFLYAAPVTAASAVGCALGSLAIEGATLAGTGPTSLWGFLGDSRVFGLTLGAAIVAGMFGHTSANLALQHVSPLILSVILLFEPLVGSLLGYAVGVQGVPGVWTLVAGPIMVVGAGLVTLGGRDASGRPAAAAAKAWVRARWRGDGAQQGRPI
jgi:drug/metabolite transporter (DMT)-like permease